MIDVLDGSFYEAAFGDGAHTVDEIHGNALRLSAAYMDLVRRASEVLTRVYFDRPYWDRETRIAIMHTISSMVLPSALKLSIDGGTFHALLSKITREVYSHLRTEAEALDVFTRLHTPSGEYEIREAIGSVPTVYLVGDGDAIWNGKGLFEFLRAQQHDITKTTANAEPSVSVVSG